MKVCTRIPLIFVFPNGKFEGALVHIEGNDFVKLFVKSSDKEMSFEVDPSLIENPDESVLLMELNDFLEDLVHQAKLDFPTWLEEYATEFRYPDDEGKVSLPSIRKYWNEKQMYFGIFRISSEIGLITDRMPAKASALCASAVQVEPRLSYTIKG